MGGSGNGTNPEQLFAAGYSACFHSALRLVARRAKVDPGESTVTAEVGIGPEGDAYGLVVTLIINIPGLDQDRTRNSPRRRTWSARTRVPPAATSASSCASRSRRRLPGEHHVCGPSYAQEDVSACPP